MNEYVSLSFLGMMFFLLIGALAIEISVIAEIYREKKQHNRQKDKNPSKSDNSAALDVRLSR